MLVGLRLKDLTVMNANSFINFEMAKTCQLSVVLYEVLVVKLVISAFRFILSFDNPILKHKDWA